MRKLIEKIQISKSDYFFKGFTLAEGATHVDTFDNKRKCAFTLAEVLITLAVIGVVAAITLPALIDKINNQIYDRARQKALMSIGEAGRMLAVQGEIGLAINAEDFVKNYLSKRLKIAKYCGSDYTDCGFSETINKLGTREKITIPLTVSELSPSNKYPYALNSNGYAFLTADGISTFLFYNSNCKVYNESNDYYYVPQRNICFNAIYDVNGMKNPNLVGKDIGFLTLFYPDETSMSVSPHLTEKDVGETSYKERAVAYCSEDGYILPTKEEAAAMFYNLNLTNLTSNKPYWTNSNTLSGKHYVINASEINGLLYRVNNSSAMIRCLVK